MFVIWDLDGTVWDSEPGIAASLAHALRALGMAVPPDEELRSFTGHAAQAHARRARRAR
jgi:phosphoglycolate phosphatase